EQVQLGPLVAPGVHAEDQFGLLRAVVGGADALAGEGKLHRLAAFDRYLPELGDAGGVGEEGDGAAVRRERGPGRGVGGEVAVDAERGSHEEKSFLRVSRARPAQAEAAGPIRSCQAGTRRASTSCRHGPEESRSRTVRAMLRKGPTQARRSGRAEHAE